MRLHDHAASGNCYKVRLLLALLALPYERVEVDIFAGDTLTDAFAALNPVRETPVLELDDGTTITQSNAILAYLAHGTRLPPAERLEQAQVHQWLAFEQERVMGGIGGPRFRRAHRAGRRSPGAWRPAAARSRCSTTTWRARDWLVGDGPTIADVSVFGYAHVAPDAGLESRRAVAAWMRRMRALDGFVADLALYGRTPARRGRPQHLRLTPRGARRLPRRCPPAAHDLEARRRAARAGLRDGAERAGARAHFRSIGIDPERLDGPIVGIASTWTGTMPCNFTQRELSDAAAAAVDAAGGVALPFNTIAVSDNQSQGTPGMRASLISREVIADSIELMSIAHDFDALVCIVGCDKTTPAALMALARLDKPAVLLYSGPQRAGRLGDRELTILEVWEARRRARARDDRPRRARRDRARGLPGRGHVRGPVHGQHDGRGARVPRARRARRRADPAPRTARTRPRPRRAPGARAVALAGTDRDRAALPRPPRAAQRDGGRRRERRLDQRRAAPARDRARGRASSSRRTS